METSNGVEIAVFGLGRMGMQIAKRLHKNGFKVLAWNRHEEPRGEFFEIRFRDKVARGKRQARLLAMFHC